MAKVIGINGILSHGACGTDLALKDLSGMGYTTLDYDYPMRTALSAWFNKNRWDDAKGLLELTEGGDHILAHSYGCLIVLEAMRMGAKFDQVFFFGAAASSDRYPWFPMLPDACNDLYVVYNPADRALRYGSMIPFHPFGKLGYKGYRGTPDDRVHSIPAMLSDDIVSHNNHLNDTHRKSWVTFISNQIIGSEARQNVAKNGK
jgi:pimeloyl-ACP methyl ester carboxylesterase